MSITTVPISELTTSSSSPPAAEPVAAQAAAQAAVQAEAHRTSELNGDVRAGRCLSICLINPRFEPSFWSNDYALKLYPNGKRCQILTGAPPALAGLLDRRHNIVIIDENVESIDFDALAEFDVIGVTGMIVQRWRMQEILRRLRELPAQVAVGGPLVTCDERLFDGLCDTRFIGEAEQTWPRFIEDVAAGRPTEGRYEQSERSDMSVVPRPRLDLIKASRYAVASVQFSRGCPFLCEFCDIIVMFGRRPRVKRPEQVIAELEDVRAAGFGVCFLVDDNFIGNKKAAKELLRAIIAWQQRNGYPLIFSTEASVNLADDAEMLELMEQANFTHVFLGIESPSPASLKATRKTQNLVGDSMTAKIRRIREAGIIVVGGFIVGFDEDTPEIFDAQYQFIEDSGIGLASIGILAPLPTTPLYDRLEAAGRLYPADPECAFIPANMTREQLKQGHRDLMRRVFAPQAFFERVLRTYHESTSFGKRRAKINASSARRPTLRLRLAATMVLARLLATLLGERRAGLMPAYWRAWRSNRRLGNLAIPYSSFVDLCAKHWHFYKIADGRQNSVYLQSNPEPAESSRS